jgi:hypothetical protein
MVSQDSMTERKISVFTENQIQIGQPITNCCTKLPQHGFIEDICYIRGYCVKTEGDFFFYTGIAIG